MVIGGTILKSVYLSTSYFTNRYKHVNCIILYSVTKYEH